MNNKLTIRSDIPTTDGGEEDEIAVKEAIERLNALYESVCKNAQTLRSIFIDCGIESREGFYNNHAIGVGYGYLTELYPIPVVTAKIEGVSVDVGFDVVSRNGNIGFVELTVDKAVLIALDFSKLSEFEFAVYGIEHYPTEYWFGDAEITKELVEKSDERQFHIGLEFPDMEKLKKILDIFGIPTGEQNGKVSFVKTKKIGNRREK